jgi:O-antigen ligase
MITRSVAVLNKDKGWAIVFGFLAIAMGGFVALLTTYVSSNMVLFVLVATPFIALGFMLKPQWGLLFLVFMVYVRLSDVLIKSYGAPSTAKPFIALLFLIIIVRWLLYQEKPEGWQRPTLLIVTYGLVGMVSFFYAVNLVYAQDALLIFVKDAIIAVIVAILLQRATTLRQVIWVLLIAGIFLGTLSAYQYLTGTFENDYWGFSQAELKDVVGEGSEYRIGGPRLGPNTYAQFLIVLVPLALDRLWNERNLWWRILAGWSLAVCLLTIIFTFSRGGFLALIVVLAIMFIRRPPKPMAILLTVLVAGLIIQYLPENYTQRLLTISELVSGNEDNIQDQSFRGRLSENLAGWQMFTDHPFLGVGLNNFKNHYQEYSRNIGLDPRREERSPHSLYLEILSQQGLLGLAWHIALVWVIFYGLKRARDDFMVAGMPDYASMTVALGIGIFSLFITGIFLHSPYPRYFWLLYGIALAIPYVAQKELKSRQNQEMIA